MVNVPREDTVIATSEDIVHCRELVARQTGAMLFESADAEAGRSLLFHEPLDWLEVRSLDQIPDVFAAIEKARAEGYWVAGYLGYECGYHWEPTACPGFIPDSENLPLAAFGVYRDPVACARTRVSETAGEGVLRLTPSLSCEQFATEFNRVQQWIASGDTYQVNLTFRVRAICEADPAALFTHMMHTQPVRFGAMLHIGDRVLLSASPELFFHLQDRNIVVRPMKGTAPRGHDPIEDEQLAQALAADQKNRAENIMIVDLLRSDLGRIAEVGSVHTDRLFAIERHPSLLQMTSEIKATLREDVDAYKLFAALFPSGSIVGAPKVRTMQLIRALEQRDRNVYTGAIGFFSPQKEAVFSVAIRTAVLSGGELTMGIGSGITAGSEPQPEYEECLLKAQFLRDRSFGLIETMRWESGGCALLPRHIHRLKTSTAELAFQFDRNAVQQAIEEHGNQLPAVGAFKLRLVLNAQGTCTFSPTEEVAATTDTALPVRLWPTPVRSSDPWLRYKTTHRHIYDDALREARAEGLLDVIFMNERGGITEGAIHSVFVRHANQWRTPPLSAGVLPGVYRSFLLETNSEIVEQEFGAGELWSADEMWLTNAVRGVRKVILTR